MNGIFRPWFEINRFGIQAIDNPLALIPEFIDLWRDDWKFSALFFGFYIGAPTAGLLLAWFMAGNFTQ